MLTFLPFFQRLQEEIHLKEEAENNLAAFRAVSPKCFLQGVLENEEKICEIAQREYHLAYSKVPA